MPIPKLSSMPIHVNSSKITITVPNGNLCSYEGSQDINLLNRVHLKKTIPTFSQIIEFRYPHSDMSATKIPNAKNIKITPIGQNTHTVQFNKALLM